MNNVGRDIFSSSVLIVLSAWVFYETSAYPSDVSMMPRLMAAVILCFSAIIIIRKIISTLKGGGDGPVEAGRTVAWKILVPFLTLWAISISVASTLGFYVTMGIFWLALTLLLEGTPPTSRQILKQAGSGLGIILVLYLVFRVLVGVPTPTGIFV